jgi:hypothetical protein
MRKKHGKVGGCNMNKFSSVIFCLLLGVLTLSLTACYEEETVPVRKISELRFNIQVNYASAPNTKSVKTDWEDGDKIYVFFNVSEGATTGYLNATKYVTLTYKGETSKWEGAASSGLTNVLELGTAGTMYGIFFPFGDVSIASDGSSGVTFRTAGNATSMLNGKPIYTYYMTSVGVPYTITDAGFVATLTGTLNMTIPDGYVYFFVNKEGDKYCANEKCRLSAEGVVPTACTSYSAGTFTESSIAASKPLWGYAYGENGVAFSAKVDDTWADAGDHKFYFFSDGDPAMTRNINGVLDISGSNHPSVKLSSPRSAPWARAMTTPTYTLMGDGQNGQKWADWNVGANSVNDPGIAFRYGEIIPPVGDYDDATGNGGYELFNNYPLLDVARAWLGSDWRSPSKTEMAALKSYNTSSLVNSGVVSGGTISTAGYKFVNKTNSSNSIFFPKRPTSSYYDAGYWTATSYNSNKQTQGYFYASSTISNSRGDKNRAYDWRPIYIGE